MKRSHPRGRRLGQVAALPLLAVMAVPLLAAVPAQAAPPGRTAAAGTYLVRVRPGALATTAADVRRSGGTVRSTLTPLATLVVTLPAGRAAALRGGHGVLSVEPDAAGHLLESSSSALPRGYDPTVDPSSMYSLTSAIGARAAWLNGAGEGIDVALIDSGVAAVPGLDGPGKVVQGPDLSFESQDDARAQQDTYGHGTHMAGIIAGHDTGTPIDPSYDPATAFLGVAPASHVVSVRVAGANGATDVSQVIAGISWVIEHAHDPGLNIRVLNLSFGTDSTQDYTVDPLAFAAEQAWKHGIVVVTSAGNGGEHLGHLTDPAIDPFVLAVGAADNKGNAYAADDVVAGFSGRGPSDGLGRNPDLVAPGTHVQSLLSPGSAVDQAGSAGQVGGRFQRGSGTSQAAAVVSGSVALLLSQRPGLTPDAVKWLLMNTARPLGGFLFPRISAVAQGRGVVNLKKALSTTAKAGLQDATPSDGTGSLDQARGSVIVTDGTTELHGDQDIFGHAYDSADMARQIAGLRSWTGGAWNGSTWAGSTWAGSTWAGSTWAGSTWAGSTWAGSTWAGSTWAGSTWAGSTWAGSTWAASGWE